MEGREYVCSFYEKIMDAIELESSGGVLTKWINGFDMMKINKRPPGCGYHIYLGAIGI